MDFYNEVTEGNAQEWYDHLPTHLRKQVDTEIQNSVRADVKEVKMDLPTAMVNMVVNELGYNLPDYVQVNDSVDGNTVEECERFEKRKQWCLTYNRLTFLQTVVKSAPKMQKERKMLAHALGLKQGGNGLPSQAEGLDDTQAATIRWLQTSGETPLEYLTSVYRNDDSEVRTSDKIAAARALLDYVHRKVPAQIEVKGPSTEDAAEHAAIARDIGDQLAKYAAITKKLDK